MLIDPHVRQDRYEDGVDAVPAQIRHHRTLTSSTAMELPQDNPAGDDPGAPP